MKETEKTAKVGNTPTVFDGFSDAFLKLECSNPSGSHKDRETLYLLGKYGWNRKYVVASSGNAGISLAYWAKRNATVLVPAITPTAKIEAIQSLGAKVVVTGRYYHETYGHVGEFARKEGLVNVSPGFVERWRGDMPIASELKDLRLDYVFVPSSNCTLAYGVAVGFRELLDAGLIEHVPTVVACVVPNHPFLQKTKAISRVFRKRLNSIYTLGGKNASLERRFPLLANVKLDSERRLGAVFRLENKYPEYDAAVWLAVYVSRKYSGRKAVIATGVKR